MTPIDKAIAALEEIREFFEENGDIDQAQLDFFMDRRETILYALTELKAARPIPGLQEAIEHFKYTTVVNWSDPTVSKMFEALKEAAKRYQGRGG